MAAVQPTDRIDVRCPKCKRLQFVLIQSGTAVIEVKCRCSAALIVDMATGAILSALMDNKHKPV